MLVNCFDFYSLNHRVNSIKNIRFVSVQAMVSDKISGCHLPIDLTFIISTNSTVQPKAMPIFVSIDLKNIDQRISVCLFLLSIS